MLHLNELSKTFGAQVILDEASLHVKPGMRLGLIGPNGAGKTTLLRIIAGEMSADGGEINARKDLKVGFLPQEIEEIADHTVMEEVLASYSDILDLEQRMKLLGERLAEYGPAEGRSAPELSYGGDGGSGASSDPEQDAEDVLAELGSLQTAFEAGHGYELEARAQSIARGMGFGESDFDRPIVELSGGWRMRVALARLLMEHPDLLLLDEPTNHLDLESLLWLEDFLLDWSGSLILISHDRYFLNRLVTHIAELDRGVIDLYTGDYDRFEKEKRLRYESLASASKNQQREIDQAESFIRRFRAKNTKAKQVQQKIRYLEKMGKIDVPDLGRKEIRFRFPQPGRIGRVAVEVSHVRKAYGEIVVYDDLNVVVERGEKIALVGPNGAGKSTLLKLLAGVIEPDAGRIKLGHQVRQEYFAQHQLEVFDPRRTVLKTMEEAAGPVDRVDQVRDFLGTFLFSGDDVDKPVGVLSGGEKARLALARMLLDPAGLLLLDEPTNHLDMASREVLIEALRQFQGSIVFISHDRHLINSIASKVIEVDSGRLVHYLGDWEYYQWKRGRRPEPVPATAEEPAGGTVGRDSTAGPKPAISSPRPAFAANTPSGAKAAAGGTAKPVRGNGAGRHISREERKTVRRRHQQAEKRILELEERQEELAHILSAPEFASDYAVLAEASEEAGAVREELGSLYEEWEELAEKVASLDD